MELFYCNPKTQQELLRTVHQIILDYIEDFALNPLETELLLQKSWEDYELKFDPIDQVGPVEQYLQLIVPNAPDRMDWMKNTIESLLLRSPYLIGSGQNVKSKVGDCAFNLLSRIDESFRNETDYPGALKYLIEKYIGKVLDEDFEIKKLDSDEVDIYCNRIELKEINAFEKDNKFPLRIVKKNRLVFNVNIDIKSNTNSGVRCFGWNGSEEGLRALHNYLGTGLYIKTNDFQVFAEVFKNQPVENIKEKLEWIHKSKGGEYTSGLILDFIVLLISKGLIGGEYPKRNAMNSTIKACFILGNGKPPKVDDKKVTSQKNPTKAIKEFNEFLTQIPSLPS